MKNLYVICCCALLVSLAGCPQLVGPDESNNRNKPVPIGFSGDLTVTNNTTTINGSIADNIGSGRTIRNVTLLYYTSDGHRTHSTVVGTLNESTQTIPISDSVSPPPKYIIIHSPDIWSQTDVYTDYFVLQTVDSERGYKHMVAENKSELPVQIK